MDHTPPFRLPRVLEILLGVVVLLELIAPFVAKTYGVDGPSQLNLIREFGSLVYRGEWLPKWVPEAFHGYGTTTFYFYPPFAFYATTFVRFVTGIADPKFLFQLTGFIATIASFFTARIFLKSLPSGSKQANLGAVLYAFAPYRIAEIYTRSSISSQVGYVFLPLVWMGAISLFSNEKEKQVSGIFILAIASSLLILSSIPLTAVTILSLAVAGLVRWRSIDLKVILCATVAIILISGLTAFYLIPVIQNESLVQMHYTLVVPEFIANDLPNFWNLPTAYHEFLMYAAVAIAFAGYWKNRNSEKIIERPERILVQIGIAIALLIFYLEIPFASIPVWKHFMLVTLTQGGERFYIQIVLFGATFVAIAHSKPMAKASQRIVWLWALGSLVPILLVILNVHVFHHIEIPVTDPSEYLPVYVPTNGRDELTVLEKPTMDSDIRLDLGIQEYAKLITRSPHEEQYAINLQATHAAVFHRFYWPHWHLYINGTEVPSHPDSLGRAVAIIPSGNYTAVWKLERTSVETAGLWISGLTAAGMFCVGFFQFRPPKRNSEVVAT